MLQVLSYYLSLSNFALYIGHLILFMCIFYPVDLQLCNLLMIDLFLKIIIELLSSIVLENIDEPLNLKEFW